MSDNSTNDNKPTFSTEDSKKETKKGSNYQTSIGFATKRHAMQENGIYNQAVWNQQFDSMCRKWGREERSKKATKKGQ